MASKELIINDDYCRAMQSFFTKHGDLLDTFVQEYVSILSELNQNGISSGEVAKALTVFIMTAGLLKQQNSSIATETCQLITKYLEQIDRYDRYLY